MKKKVAVTTPQEKIYVVMERGTEYNDEYTEIHDSGQTVNAYRSKTDADNEAKRRMIELFKRRPKTSWDNGLFDLGSYDSELLEAVKDQNDRVPWLNADDDSYSCEIPRGLTERTVQYAVRNHPSTIQTVLCRGGSDWLSRGFIP